MQIFFIKPITIQSKYAILTAEREYETRKANKHCIWKFR